MRRRIIDFLVARRASPRDISDELELDLETISYHVRKLRDLGVISLVDEEPVRGAVRHIYRALPGLQGTSETESLSAPERARLAQLIAELAAADAGAARRAGTLGSHRWETFARHGGELDEEGLEAILRIQLDAQRRVEAALTEANSRITNGETKARAFVRIVTVAIEVPKPDVPLE